MGKGSAMKSYCTIQLPHARPTMHCIPLVYKHTRIKPDPQFFLGMVAHAQTVDTRPFFFCERPGYEANSARQVKGEDFDKPLKFALCFGKVDFTLKAE